jgi:hypothetical protein
VLFQYATANVAVVRGADEELLETEAAKDSVVVDGVESVVVVMVAAAELEGDIEDRLVTVDKVDKVVEVAVLDDAEGVLEARAAAAMEVTLLYTALEAGVVDNAAEAEPLVVLAAIEVALAKGLVASTVALAIDVSVAVIVAG